MCRLSSGFVSVGWRLVTIVLAALVLEFSRMHFLMVEGQTLENLPIKSSAFPPLASIPPLSSLPPVSLPPQFPPVPPFSLPPGLPPIAIPPIPDVNNVTSDFSAKLMQITVAITASIAKSYSFCFVNAKSDESKAFDFSQSGVETIAQTCLADVGADFVDRVCGNAEIGSYFNNINSILSTGITSNINCSPQNWPKACQSGWAGTLSSNSSENSTTIPPRSANAKACCPGFFCPPGLTCMIPCPLGSYCPSTASYEPTTGRCLPYGYKAETNTTECGGADLWLSFNDARPIFCGTSVSGTYCPDTITETVCENGHFCRVGSTYQSKCSFLTKCAKTGLQNEDVTTTGILLLVLLFVLLLLVYTCSEKLMHIRDRRKSKVRDVAARQARESVSAVERWKKVKEAAKNARSTALKVSGEVSRTFNRRKSRFSFDELKHAHQLRSTAGENGVQHSLTVDDQPFSEHRDEAHRSWSLEETLQSDVEPQAAADAQELHLLAVPSASSPSRVRGSPDLYPVHRPLSFDLYPQVEVPDVVGNGTVEDAAPAKETTSRKSRASTKARTQTEVYKYAYGQIEKEKFRQSSKPRSLTDVVNSDGFRKLLGGTRRFQMELAFVDLTLTLKGSGKRILNNVTGKFSPSRVTAVMGPSGAGKTTFLNALAGKETGSVISGQVFINGHPGSIQSYKRIIGFVPQDDIVHGSLTVEENLTFSSKYRLPEDTPRQERVLVVERIINELGLNAIRDSLVGTVEKRGISGGQRKRVNVGMELVIEPSVLILDEPTSGLDSTSSRLVMQSLLREAALGVNVCVVLHQPSFALFSSFHDVMFLAKGGYTVYLGPVTEIEAYFSSLGFDVPDRINPPDYFMDVLERLVVPDDNPSFDITELPLLWMCHNGYHIPPHLQTSSGRDSSNPGRTERDVPSIFYDVQKSFIHEAWDELRVYVLVKWDLLKTSFSIVKNLSGRQTPGFLPQFGLIFRRVSKQKFREPRLIAQDFIILLLAGICVGVLANWKDVNLGGTAYIYTIIAVALLIMIASLRTFSADKLQFWRESSSGINRVAFFLAKDTVDHSITLIKPLVYLSMFYFFNNPRSTFASNYLVTLALVYCCTGLGYILAIILNPQPAQLFSVFIPVMATLLVSDPRSGVVGKIAKWSYAYWAQEAYTIANASRYSGVWLITRCEELGRFNYRLDNYQKCLGILVAYGLVARVVAYLCLLLFHRKRQK